MNDDARGRIVQINISTGGVPKHPIAEGVITAAGLAGDKQKERLFHGGPTRALCLWGIELIEALAAEGHPILAGSAGENITTRGLPWSGMIPGARLRLGDMVTIEITDYAKPCKKNARWFHDGNFNRMNQKRHAGTSRVYARVLTPGTVRPGDAITWL